MKRIGILTGGGDCPGLNAVIRAAVRTLVRDHGLEVVGIQLGFEGLLTRAIDPPKTPLHHAEYYLALVAALGAPPAPRVAALRVDQGLRDRAVALLTDAGWHGEPIVSFAPGAAFGTAKRWPPDRAGAVAAMLA